MKNILLILLIPLLLSGCYKVNINYSADDSIFIFTESPLIEYSLSDKKMSYSFYYMKNKRERFKYIKKIERLNNLALKKFRKKELNTKNYYDVTLASQLTLRIVSWIAIMESSQGNMVNKQLSKQEFKDTLKSLKLDDPELENLINKSNFETEDGILEFLKLVVAKLESVILPNK